MPTPLLQNTRFFTPAALLCLLFLLFATGRPASAQTIDFRVLIRQVEDQYMGRSSDAVMSMEVRTEHWERHMEMRAWSLGRDRFLVRILDPPKEKGVATLKVDQEVWNYLPKVDRVIKIPPSMMGGSWMGSHITNNDLVKAAHIDQDYDFSLLEENDRVWIIEGLPKPEAAVVWGKIVYQVEKGRRVPEIVKYFDEKMIEVREIRFDQVQEIDGRFLPMRMTVQPLEDPAEKTVMLYRKIDFDVPIEPNFFSLRSLKTR